MPGAGTRRYSAAESTCTATGVRPCRHTGSRERFVVQVSGMGVVLSRVQTIRPVSGARTHAPPAPTARWGVLHSTNALGTNSCSRGTGASRADRCLTSDGLGNTQYKATRGPSSVGVTWCSSRRNATPAARRIRCHVRPAAGYCTAVAQGTERLASNQGVGSSNLSGGLHARQGVV
jgi:hypothetical protein